MSTDYRKVWVGDTLYLKNNNDPEEELHPVASLERMEPDGFYLWKDLRYKSLSRAKGNFIEAPTERDKAVALLEAIFTDPEPGVH
jgi:hypothetical protein